jgi:hypothetical protein
MGKLVQNLVKRYGEKCRDGILGHKFNKRLDSFAACYSQSLLLADLKKIMLFSGFKNPYKNLWTNLVLCAKIMALYLTLRRKNCWKRKSY